MKLLVLLFSFTGVLFGAKEHTVTQKDKKFDKTTLTISKGDSIKFINADSTTHHLMFKAAKGGKMVSKKQKAGADPIVQKFDEAMDTTVRCAIHPKMKLKVTVK